MKKRRQFFGCLFGTHIHGTGIGIKRFHHNGKSQFPAISVINGTAGRIESLHSFCLVQRHFFIMVALYDLHPHKTEKQETADDAEDERKPDASLPHPISGQFLFHVPFSS